MIALLRTKLSNGFPSYFDLKLNIFLIAYKVQHNLALIVYNHRCETRRNRFRVALVITKFSYLKYILQRFKFLYSD